MPARKKSVDDTESMNFEEAVARISEIVESMESDQLPLEDLVSQYEKGSALLKHCESVLSSARKKIELITLANRGENGQDTTQLSSPHAKNTSSDTVEDPDNPNDIRLF
ncbi:MAG: exodeoxyribonuclease small subunit [Verrucomicrobiota bacterium]|jgi:exodeoxyribonuclease VII small subunit